MFLNKFGIFQIKVLNLQRKRKQERMKSIDEAGVEWHLSHPDADKEETWKAGANYALDAIEEFMDNKYFGSNNAEMFYKDLKANIHKFIEQLKKK